MCPSSKNMKGLIDKRVTRDWQLKTQVVVRKDSRIYEVTSYLSIGSVS